MPAALRRRVAVVAAKSEASEGVAETVSASDADILVYDPKFDTDFKTFERDPARASFSRLAHLMGMQAAKVSLKAELKGSGTVATAPSWGKLLLGCGFQENRVTKCLIGAVTSGPFVPGETITQTTSGATGRVVGECATGDAAIFFVPLSGVFLPNLLVTGGTSGATCTTSASTGGANYRIAIGAIASGPYVLNETITGGTSAATGRVLSAHANGATHLVYSQITGAFVTSETITGAGGAVATSSAAPQANMGFEYKPLSTGDISLTVAKYMNGTRQQIFGARGNVKISAQVGEPAFLEFDYMGVYDATTDATILTPTYETTIPPVFMGVGFSVQSLSAVFTKIDIDMKCKLQPRESANASKGILACMIGDRNPSGPIDPELTLVATHDFFGKLASGATGRMAFKIGSTAGNVVWVAGPLVQYEKVGDGDRGGIAVADTDLAYRSASVNTNDDEVIIACI